MSAYRDNVKPMIRRVSEIVMICLCFVAALSAQAIRRSWQLPFTHRDVGGRAGIKLLLVGGNITSPASAATIRFSPSRDPSIYRFAVTISITCRALFASRRALPCGTCCLSFPAIPISLHCGGHAAIGHALFLPLARLLLAVISGGVFLAGKSTRSDVAFLAPRAQAVRPTCVLVEVI